jgi:hypothetical protein
VLHFVFGAAARVNRRDQWRRGVSGGMKVVEKRRFENPFSSGWIFFRHFV